MTGRLAKSNDRHVGDFARFTQPGVTNVANEKCIKTLLSGPFNVVKDLLRFDEFQVSVLIPNATTLFNAVHFDLGVGIGNACQDASQGRVVGRPSRHFGHALVPNLHGGLRVCSGPRTTSSKGSGEIIATMNGLVIAENHPP